MAKFQHLLSATGADSQRLNLALSASAPVTTQPKVAKIAKKATRSARPRPSIKPPTGGKRKRAPPHARSPKPIIVVTKRQIKPPKTRRNLMKVRTDQSITCRYFRFLLRNWTPSIIQPSQSPRQRFERASTLLLSSLLQLQHMYQRFHINLKTPHSCQSKSSLPTSPLPPLGSR